VLVAECRTRSKPTSAYLLSILTLRSGNNSGCLRQGHPGGDPVT
jgi:hypothetical protein